MSDRIKCNLSLLKEINWIIKNYRQFWKVHEVHGFNVFLAISDIYYRQNFHSDFMVMLLDTSSPHHEGGRFLLRFIEQRLSFHLPFSLTDVGAAMPAKKQKELVGRINRGIIRWGKLNKSEQRK